MISDPSTGNTIPTEPEEFDLAAIKQELLAIQAILPKVQPYWDKEFRDLPLPIQEKVRSLKLINRPTQSGIESVDGLIWQLVIARDLADKLLAGESIQKELTTILETEVAEPVKAPQATLKIPTSTSNVKPKSRGTLTIPN